MSLSFLLGITLFAGAVLYFILHPLLSGRHAPLGASDDEMTDAESRRRVSLLALRDVEYDRVTGKLDQHDYDALKREISSEALHALAVEEAERERPAGDGAAGARTVIDFETEVRRVREGLKAGNTCRICGHVNPAGSRFCSSCGGALGGQGQGR
jgi:cytochrome c-type biogenesis protein CcmI